jgi:class 3 adenylate cyclase
MSEERTAWWHAHPADRERVARARSEAATGIFRSDGPATVLFADIEDLARKVTQDHYRELELVSRLEPVGR